MAAVVDSFEFLLREVTRNLSKIRDILTIIGLLYSSNKALQISYFVLKAANDHLLSKLSHLFDLRKRFGPWAVVTGSSEGIGKAYAQELARRGVNIVLISRGENKLFKAAKEIEEEFGVKTVTVAADFSKGQEVYDKIWEKIKDKEIGILVNNVGVMYDYPNYFLDVPVEKLWQIIHVNTAAATIMTHMIMPQMVQRRRGAVVMVSSGSCSQITPQMTVYAASKSFLDYFARCLHYEYKDEGIVVQSLMPFYVATKMTRYSDTLSSPSLLIPSANEYAKQAISTLGYTNRTSGYWPHAVQAWFSAWIPEWLWTWGAIRLNNALRRQAHERLQRRRLRSSPSNQSLDSDT